MLKRIAALIGLIMVASIIVYSPELIQAQGDTERGHKLYLQYCASCHGMDGKGGGFVAPELKSRMPDLTRIARVNGKFPSLRVQQIIGGEVVTRVHGEKDMPVWGPYLRHKFDAARAKLDIYALTLYIESIQAK